jgi:HD-like signal output (HDOD) protein
MLIDPLKKIELLKSIEEGAELPVIPNSTVKLMKMTADPNVSLKQISTVVSQDAVFVTRLLRIVNSAYYGLSKNVKTVEQAVSLLGVRIIRNISITISMSDIFSPKENPAYEKLLQKSLCSAVAADLIAEILNLKSKEDLFLAALLQYSGQFILLKSLEDKYLKILKIADGYSLPLNIVEQKILGYHYSDVGLVIAKHWNLPDSVHTAITYHITDHSDKLNVLKGYEREIAVATFLSAIVAQIFFDSNKLESMIWFQKEITALGNIDKSVAFDVIDALPQLLKSILSDLDFKNNNLGFDNIKQTAEDEIAELKKKRLKVFTNYIQLKQK